jgi:hypothetical protein
VTTNDLFGVRRFAPAPMLGAGSGPENDCG